MTDKRSVGLALDPAYYDKLRAYAKARHIDALATAARMIVCERLDQEEEDTT